MLDFLQTQWFWELIAVALAGFVLGRATAPNPIDREQRRRQDEAAARQGASRLSPATLAAVRADLAGGKVIAAVKRVRDELGAGLKQAKDIVERIRNGGS